MNSMAITLNLFVLLVSVLCVTALPLSNTSSTTAAGGLSTSGGNTYSLNDILKCQYLNKLYLNKLYLNLRHFQNKDITCNDGTAAGYYIRRSYGSKKWIIYLQGGWYCFTDSSCIARTNSSMKELMSSRGWFSKRRGTGILSPSSSANPSWWNANHVFVPYCSSDAWSGNVSSFETGGKFSFMGYRIINEVIKELLTQGLLNSDDLLFTGSSAGGVGVMMNIDRVADMMKTAGSSCQVRGLSDSGWYMEKKMPDMPGCKSDPKKCGKPFDALAKGMSYWRGVVPTKCAEAFQSQPWRCYFAQNIYRTLKTPVFVTQWQYDITQLAMENPAAGMLKSLKFGQKLLRKVFELVNDLKKSLHDSGVSGVFFPACVSHSILTNSNWLSTTVEGYSLDQALNCWFNKTSQNHSTPSSLNLPSTPCKSILVDSCGYPLCNQWCPLARNPFTGQIIITTSNSQGISLNPKQVSHVQISKFLGRK